MREQEVKEIYSTTSEELKRWLKDLIAEGNRINSDVPTSRVIVRNDEAICDYVVVYEKPYDN
jgi:hypothetical protein